MMICGKPAVLLCWGIVLITLTFGISCSANPDSPGPFGWSWTADSILWQSPTTLRLFGTISNPSSSIYTIQDYLFVTGFLDDLATADSYTAISPVYQASMPWLPQLAPGQSWTGQIVDLEFSSLPNLPSGATLEVWIWGHGIQDNVLYDTELYAPAGIQGVNIETQSVPEIPACLLTVLGGASLLMIARKRRLA